MREAKPNLHLNNPPGASEYFKENDDQIENERRKLHQLSSNASPEFKKLHKQASGASDKIEADKYLTAMKYLELIDDKKQRSKSKGNDFERPDKSNDRGI